MGFVRAPQAPAGLRPAELDHVIFSIDLRPNSAIECDVGFLNQRIYIGIIVNNGWSL
jgi:hypothetical protein